MDAIASLSLVMLFCTANSLTRVETPVKIASVEPDSPYLNPNGRLLKNRHPARFRIVLENQTTVPQKGVLAAEVIGNLGTVYHVSREIVQLAAGEKRLVWVLWAYPGDIVFPNQPGGAVHLMGAHWGHELRVAWIDVKGRVLDRGWTVFAIDQDGSPENTPQPERTEPVTPRQAFDIRYSGYLKNPVFIPAQVNAELKIKLGDKFLTGLLQGVAPSGNMAFLLPLPPTPHPVQATVTFMLDGRRLAEAWLLDPENPAGPRAQRLYHRADGKTFSFEVPAVGPGATLVMETARAHSFIAPVPLSEMVALGEQKYGPIRSMLPDDAGRPPTNAVHWAEVRKRLRATIWKALHIAPVPKNTPLNPITLSEEFVPPQGWPNGVSQAYLRRKVSIQIRPDERMNLWVLIPQGIGPFPAIITLHQTVHEGKDEPVGLGGHFHVLNFGPFLASRGFVVIAPDSPTAGERYDPNKGPAYDTTAMTAGNPTWSLMGERLRDHMRAIDYLETLPFVDCNRIGAIGHSLGGESTMMLMAMDDRIDAAVLSCGFTLLRTLEDAADTYAPPNSAILSKDFRKLLQAPVRERKLPFDFDDCMALWAPRPVFMHGVKTDLWSNAAQVAQAAMELKRVYQFLGAEDRFYVVYSNQTHSFPSWVQQDAFDWLDYWLKGPHSPK